MVCAHELWLVLNSALQVWDLVSLESGRRFLAGDERTNVYWHALAGST